MWGFPWRSRQTQSTVTPPANGALLHTYDLVRTYQMGGEVIRALDGVTLTIQPGEFVSIMGRSGSGKSTLLNVIGCLDRPTAGTVWLDGVDLARAPAGELPHLRARKIGFVFQQFNLVPSLTAAENVMLPLKYAGFPAPQRRERAHEVLALVGMAERAQHLPSQLSGGQQQRVAIARALANRPALVLADEPTGALDTRTAAEVIGLLRHLNRAEGQTCIIVTHDPLVSGQTDRLVRLRDGRVESDERVTVEGNEP